MDLIDISKKATEVIQQVGDYILKESLDFDVSRVEEKGLNDLVSYVDKTAERMLVQQLMKVLPNAGFLTEEGTIEEKRKGTLWVIDPLDGTTNFTHGLPIYAISVALLKEDQLALGIVYELNRNEMFMAIKGNGATCNGLPISVSPCRVLSNGLLATGFPFHNFEKMEQYLGILHEFMRTTHGLRRMGSAAVDLAYVACGRFEGFFEYNLNPWDVAAGALLVEEAGGMVSDFSGENNYLFGREIVASGYTHHDILQVVDRYWNT